SGDASISNGFGADMAITRADTDGFDDLVVGGPGEFVGSGAVHVLRGSAAGITSQGQAFWRQGSNGIPQSPQQDQPSGRIGGRFGSAVGGTTNGLLVLGAPGQTVPSRPPGQPDVVNAGWVAEIRVDDLVPVGVKLAVERAEHNLIDNRFGPSNFFASSVT